MKKGYFFSAAVSTASLLASWTVLFITMYLRAACFNVSGNVSQCVASRIKALPRYMYLLISSHRGFQFEMEQKEHKVSFKQML